MSHTTQIHAVMVTFNRLEQLQKSLPKLLDQSLDRLVVVDNASTDGTAEWLAQVQDPRLHVMSLPQNSGGAGGFEKGMAYLTQKSVPDWVLLLDDDAWPAPQTIDKFRDLIDDLPEDTAAVAAAVYLPNGEIAEMNRPGFNPFWHLGKLWSTLLRGNRAGFKLANDAYQGRGCQIDNASFVGYFVARKGWETIGLPEGGLFIYGDDVLYSLRLRRAGLNIQFAPQIQFSHDCGSMDANFVYRPLWKIYYHCRNGVTIARQAAGPLVFPLALTWYMILWARRGLRCAPPERRLYFKMMCQGVWDGLLGRRGRADHLHSANPPPLLNDLSPSSSPIARQKVKQP